MISGMTRGPKQKFLLQLVTSSNSFPDEPIENDVANCSTQIYPHPNDRVQHIYSEEWDEVDILFREGYTSQ